MATATQHSDATWNSFSEFGKLPERPRERDCQLEAEQRLRPGNDDPRLGEHLLDLRRQRRWLFLLHGPLPALRAKAESQTVPERPGQKAERASGHEGGRHSEYMIKNDVKAQPKADGKRQQRHAGKDAGDAMDANRVLAIFHDPVLHGWRHQQPDCHRHQHLPRTVHVARCEGQVGEFFLEDTVELEAEKNLGAQHQEPGFVQGCLDLLR